MSDEEAAAQYNKTGRHLGIFRDISSANAYAQALHNQQAAMLGSRVMPVPAQRADATSTAGLLAALLGYR